MVSYFDFLEALDRAIASEGRIGLGYSLSNGTGYVNGNGYDGVRGSYDSNYGGRGNDVQGSVYDSLNRFRNNLAGGNYNDGFDDLSDGGFSSYNQSNAYGGNLSPPKVTDSLHFPAARGRGGSGSPSRYHRYGSNSYDEGITPRTSYNSSIAAPRASPSKVGSKMWGSETPLSRKGKALKVGDDKWCCPVCLYVENPISAPVCAVCDTPNYNNRKVSFISLVVLFNYDGDIQNVITELVFNYHHSRIIK